jgi:hypothetical protein
MCEEKKTLKNNHKKSAGVKKYVSTAKIIFS